jgi:hypothetical protein
MSFQKTDRKFQSKSGKTLHERGGYDTRPFAEVIAAAVLAEWGGTSSARKEVGRITSANERTVRNWFEGRNSPSGENLICLLRHSDAVLDAVLRLSGRQELVQVAAVLELRDRLQSIVIAIDELQGAT